ncbi:hypothetical protein AMTR_s00043p00175190 [Amborella trichopoda]|uniref:Uncharacterized protein n=1 Tax=Amborella trichopoda TaxID=13333 RepID=W1PRX4_AMBTC|nr:hypothetical protein AMTR_s00043p00175190 [Amborella trichopoda]
MVVGCWPMGVAGKEVSSMMAGMEMVEDWNESSRMGRVEREAEVAAWCVALWTLWRIRER